MHELKARLKALGASGYSSLKKDELVARLKQELGAIEEEATRGARSTQSARSGQ